VYLRSCNELVIYYVWVCVVCRISPPSDILFSYKSQTDEVDNDEVILPNQPIEYIVPDAAVSDIASSYDSTHFTTASPNPLYYSADYQHGLLPSFGRLTFDQTGSLNAWTNTGTADLLVANKMCIQFVQLFLSL